MIFVFAILVVSVFELSSCDPPYFQFIEQGVSKPRLGHLCNEDAECEFVNSECAGERCVCIGGFERSMSHVEDTCVPGMLYLTSDYQLPNLHWTDQLKNRESKDYEALLNRLETDMRTKSDLFIDLPEAEFNPSDDGRVVANLRYHVKNPLIVKRERQTREVHKSVHPRFSPRSRGTRDLSGFLEDLIAAFIAAAAALGHTVSGVTATVHNGPLGEFCDGDCGITHASCSSSTCLCDQPDYVHLDGDDDTCHPRVELGESCSDTGECYDNQECDNSECTCEDGNVEIDDGTQCGPEADLDGRCTDDLQCTTLGSACLGTCQCVSGPRDGSTCSDAPTEPPPPETTTPACGTAVGAMCDDVTCPCNVTNSVCTDSECVCLNTHIGYNKECIERINVGSACNVDVQCPDNSECDTNCVCIDTAVLVTGEGCILRAELGAACTFEEQCTDNAECDGGTSVCECIADFGKSYVADDTCVPVEITVHLTLDVGTYHANMATVGSGEYDAQETTLGGILLTADSNFLRIENLVITDNGGTASNDFDAVFTNADTVAPSRVRRQSADPEEEPFTVEKLHRNVIRAARQLGQPVHNLKVSKK